MHVLEHDPVAFLVSDGEFLHGNDVLTLSQSDGVESLVGVHALLSGQCFDILDGVGSR